MRLGLFAAWLAAALVVWPQAVSAGATDMERDLKPVGKYAIEDVGDNRHEAKGKGLCVCLESSETELEHKLGMLLFERVTAHPYGEIRSMIEVKCRVFAYDPSAEVRLDFDPCDSWVPLAK
jgi:hypothetical protein